MRISLQLSVCLGKWKSFQKKNLGKLGLLDGIYAIFSPQICTKECKRECVEMSNSNSKIIDICSRTQPETVRITSSKETRNLVGLNLFVMTTRPWSKYICRGTEVEATNIKDGEIFALIVPNYQKNATSDDVTYHDHFLERVSINIPFSV